VQKQVIQNNNIAHDEKKLSQHFLTWNIHNYRISTQYYPTRGISFSNCVQKIPDLHQNIEELSTHQKYS